MIMINEITLNEKGEGVLEEGKGVKYLYEVMEGELTGGEHSAI